MELSSFLCDEVVEFPNQCSFSGADGFSPFGETGEGLGAYPNGKTLILAFASSTVNKAPFSKTG